MNSTTSGDNGRQALIELASRYLSALVAHDPAAVPLAPGLRTVEDLQRIKPGEGLWSVATAAPSSFAIYVPDPAQGSAGCIGLMERDGAPVLLGLRLKVDHGEIVEAEHLTAGNLAEANLPNLRVPRPGLRAEIPAAERLPADELRAIGATYYQALERDDASLSALAADCERHENGLVTAGPERGAPPPGSTFPPVASDASGQIDSGVFQYIARIENRRMFAADPVTGLVMGLSQFRHPMDNVPYDVTCPDGSTRSFAPTFAPFDLPAAHIFKVGADHRIHEIEAMGFVTSYGSPTGW